MIDRTLSQGRTLDSIQPSDKAALVEHLQDEAIYHNTLNIPHPYTEADAEAWIERRMAWREKQPDEVAFVIRNDDGRMIGAVGTADLDIGTTHRAEIGYWLATPLWGQGIMTEAVQRFSPYAFTTLKLVRLTAHVYAHNPASARVLEKCGFQQEGYFRKHFRKDGELLDARYYGLLHEDVVALTP